MSEEVLRKLKRYATNNKKPNFFLRFKNLFEKEILPLQNEPNFKEITNKILVSSTDCWDTSDAFSFLLHKNYADPNYIDSEGKTPLVHVCTDKKFTYYNRGIYARILLDYGANPRFVYEGQEVFGYMLRLFSNLCISIDNTRVVQNFNVDRYSYVSYYLEQGCKANYRYKVNHQIFSPFRDFFDFPQCLKILLLHGATISYDDKVRVASVLYSEFMPHGVTRNQDPLVNHWPYLMFTYCIMYKKLSIDHLFYASNFLDEGNILINTVYDKYRNKEDNKNKHIKHFFEY